MTRRDELHKGLPVLVFACEGDWDGWLAKEGASSAGVWLKFAKPTAGAPSVTKAQALETALRHGWTDGQLDR